MFGRWSLCCLFVLCAHGVVQASPSQLFQRYRRSTLEEGAVPYESKWMEELYSSAPDTKLRDVLIPGTHNSATSPMTHDSTFAQDHTLRFSKRIVMEWGKCQERSVLQQLQDGIRFLDIRVEQKNGEWNIYHGLLAGSFQNVMDQIGEFASSRPKEAIIIDIQWMVGFSKEEDAKVEKYLLEHPTLGPRLAQYTLGPEVTFRELWDKDQNVIVFYPQPTSSIKIWPAWLQNPWLDKENANDLLAELVEDIKDRPSSIFYVSQSVITPSHSSIFKGVIGIGPKTLKEMVEQRLSYQVEPFIDDLHKAAKDNGKNANIVIVDFYETTALVRKCLELNRADIGLEPRIVGGPGNGQAVESQPTLDLTGRALGWLMEFIG